MCHINSFKDILVVFRGLRFLESARSEAKIAVESNVSSSIGICVYEVRFEWHISCCMFPVVWYGLCHDSRAI